MQMNQIQGRETRVWLVVAAAAVAVPVGVATADSVAAAGLSDWTKGAGDRDQRRFGCCLELVGQSRLEKRTIAW